MSSSQGRVMCQTGCLFWKSKVSKDYVVVVNLENSATKYGVESSNECLVNFANQLKQFTRNQKLKEESK